MQQWEYSLFAKKSNSGSEQLSEIGRLGREGWELISVVYVQSSSVTEYYFKHPIQQPKTKSHSLMKKHLFISLFAFFLFGVGSTVIIIGADAGMNVWLTTTIYASCLLFYIVSLFTSLQKVKDALKEPKSTTETKPDQP